MEHRDAVTAPRVSVLLPVYNGAAHVGAAVESVLAQTYPDFELLVLDDCSPDESVAIAEAFGDSRIRMVRNERNLGQVATLNRGLRVAQGEYVARLDQDDVCLPERFRLQVELLDADPGVAVVGTWVDVVDEAGRQVETIRTRLDTAADTIFLTVTHGLPIAHPAVMFRRDAVLALAGYDEAVRYCEDSDLWRRLVLAGHGLRVVAEPLLRYRVHSGQQSQRHAAEQGANNDASLERFIAGIAPTADARLVRMIFTRQLDLWGELGSRDDARRLVADVRTLVDAAADRFRLAPDQRAGLEARIRRHISRAAASGWRTGLPRWWRTAPPLAHLGGQGRLRFYATYLAAPGLVAARAAAHALRR